MNSEVEGIGRGLFQCSIWKFSCSDQGKSWKSLVRIASLQAKTNLRPWDLQNI